jgi:hypothetical protein
MPKQLAHFIRIERRRECIWRRMVIGHDERANRSRYLRGPMMNMLVGHASEVTYGSGAVDNGGTHDKAVANGASAEWNRI